MQPYAEGKNYVYLCRPDGFYKKGDDGRHQDRSSIRL